MMGHMNRTPKDPSTPQGRKQKANDVQATPTPTAAGGSHRSSGAKPARKTPARRSLGGNAPGEPDSDGSLKARLTQSFGTPALDAVTAMASPPTASSHPRTGSSAVSTPTKRRSLPWVKDAAEKSANRGVEVAEEDMATGGERKTEVPTPTKAESQLKKFYDHARELGYLEKLITVLPPIDDCVFVANHILHAPTRIHSDKLFIGGEKAKKYQLWAILGLAHTRAAEVIIIKEVEAAPNQSQPGPCAIAHQITSFEDVVLAYPFNVLKEHHEVHKTPGRLLEHLKVFIRFLYLKSGRDGAGVKIFASSGGDLTKAPLDTYKRLAAVINIFEEAHEKTGELQDRPKSNGPTGTPDITQLILNTLSRNSSGQFMRVPQRSEENPSRITRSEAARTRDDDGTVDQASQQLDRLSVGPVDEMTFVEANDDLHLELTERSPLNLNGKRPAPSSSSSSSGYDTEGEHHIDIDMGDVKGLNFDQVRQKTLAMEAEIKRRRLKFEQIDQKSQEKVARETEEFEERLKAEEKRFTEKLEREKRKVEKARRKCGRVEDIKEKVKADLHELVANRAEDVVDYFFTKSQ